MSSKIKITSLVDNTVYMTGLKSEHGLSLFLEFDREKILFDCAQSNLLIKNAELLGVDLKTLDKIIISHGHYDHTGGLLAVLKYIKKEVKVYCSPKIFEKKLSETKDKKQSYRFIGMPEKKEVYENNGAVFCFVTKPEEISRNIFLSAAVKTGFFEAAKKNPFFKEVNSRIIADDMSDEVTFYYFGENINLIITGCAHRGIINILRHFGEIKEKIILKNKKDSCKAKKYSDQKLVIGGLHLFDEEENSLTKTLEELDSFRIKKIVPMHCSGFNGICFLKNKYKSGCEPGKTGMVIELSA